ncbi:hypothetical protein AB0F17_66155 [Nonomuraea sp. NPDC026600]|uniref:hypothetical protein n=1 Tax=Nonomuraea sp. NPDC026600 TaxID=3155363 RepID=UPI0033F2F5E4
MSNHEWTPYIPSGRCTRLVEASCCSAYALLQEGGAYVVVARRRPYSLSHEETARGSAALAKDVFRDLVTQHLSATQKHRP